MLGHGSLHFRLTTNDPELLLCGRLRRYGCQSLSHTYTLSLYICLPLCLLSLINLWVLQQVGKHNSFLDIHPCDPFKNSLMRKGPLTRVRGNSLVLALAMELARLNVTQSCLTLYVPSMLQRVMIPSQS